MSLSKVSYNGCDVASEEIIAFSSPRDSLCDGLEEGMTRTHSHIYIELAANLMY